MPSTKSSRLPAATKKMAEALGNGKERKLPDQVRHSELLKTTYGGTTKSGDTGSHSRWFARASGV
jgi:hypothetical protein